MKKKRLLVMYCILALFIFLSTTTVSSESGVYLWYAESLSEIGVFIGTGTGFELDREPTRMESAVMFVRLLGGENEALTQNYSHPFTDVPEWGSPYVGYLYHYELTRGISAELFGAELKVKAKSYITFAMRALGYKDNGQSADFSWDQALEYAYLNGIIDYGRYVELKEQVFLRDHMAVVSYEILKVVLKGTEITLVEDLVSRGYIDLNTAKTIGLIYRESSNILGISIGSTLETVIEILNVPDRMLLSRYGFIWYVYEENLTDYIQIGVEGNIVVAIYTMSDAYTGENEIFLGMYQYNLHSVYSEPVDRIYKFIPGDETVYIYHLYPNDYETYRSQNSEEYITYFFDSYNDNMIYAVSIIESDTEELQTVMHEAPYEALMNSFEIQTFNITNALRAKRGLTSFTWEEKAVAAARLHSLDMVERNFFSHENPDGESPFDRMEAQGINYDVRAGENIAKGYPDAIHSVQGWFNSTTGHREAILADYDYLGVGVWIDTDKGMYITQNFWK